MVRRGELAPSIWRGACRRGKTPGAGTRAGEAMVDIRSKLEELCEAFNAHDLDRIMAMFAEDCVLEMPRGSEPWGSRFEGKRQVRGALATRFAGLPDVRYACDEHYVDSSAGTGISKWMLTGTRVDGSRTEVRGCDFYTFRDGKVVRKDSYWKIVE
jgi:ketosteroid isomerase-like protein